jgi:hypothetical protein
MAAFSEGDGKTPGTTLVVEVNPGFWSARAGRSGDSDHCARGGKDVLLSPVPNLKFSPGDYAKFLRPGFSCGALQRQDTFIIVSMSIQLNPPQ